MARQRSDADRRYGRAEAARKRSGFPSLASEEAQGKNKVKPPAVPSLVGNKRSK